MTAKVAAKKEVSECSARLRSVKYAFPRGSQGTAGAAGHLRKGTKR